MIKQMFNFVAVTLLTLFILWSLGWLWFATNIALSTPDKIEDTPYEAIVVLTGGTNRVNTGMHLLAEGVSDKLFISGVNEGTHKEDILAGWKSRTKDKDDRPPCCFFLGHKATDTMGNAAEIKEWVTEQKITKFLLVTSSYHMVRAVLEVQKVLPSADIIPYPVLTNDFEAWKGRFWFLSFSEYNKTLIRWLQLTFS